MRVTEPATEIEPEIMGITAAATRIGRGLERSSISAKLSDKYKGDGHRES